MARPVNWKSGTGSAAYSLRAYKLANASLRFPALAGNTLELETHARWTDATQVPFYGLGNETHRDARVNYGLTALDFGAARPAHNRGPASRLQWDRNVPHMSHNMTFDHLPLLRLVRCAQS